MSQQPHHVVATGSRSTFVEFVRSRSQEAQALSLLIVAALIAACSSLSAAGAQVIVVNDISSVSGCEHVGHVSGGSGWGGLASNVGYRRAVESMRSETAEVGGTHVVINASYASWGGGHAEGEGYRCPPGYNPGQAQISACAKDTDCKGERICMEGRCSAPVR